MDPGLVKMGAFYFSLNYCVEGRDVGAKGSPVGPSLLQTTLGAWTAQKQQPLLLYPGNDYGKKITLKPPAVALLVGQDQCVWVACSTPET